MKLGIILKENYLMEMAANHISDEVLQKLKNGDIAGSVETYLDNHMTTKKSNKANTIAKKLKTATEKLKKGEPDGLPISFKANKEILKDIEPGKWELFAKEYEKQIIDTGAVKPRKRTKNVLTQSESGEEIATTTAKSQDKTKQGVYASIDKAINDLRNLVKVGRVSQEAFNRAKKGDRSLTAIKTVEDAEEGISALKSVKSMLSAVWKNKTAIMPPETKQEVENLIKRYDKIGKAGLKRTLIAKTLSGLDYNDVTSKEAIEKTKSAMRKRINSPEGRLLGNESKSFYDKVEKEIESLKNKPVSYLDSKKMMKDLDLEIKRNKERAERNLETIKAEHKEYLNKKKNESKEEINMDILEEQGKILKTEINYIGTNFWENKLITDHLKAFTNDCLVFGEEEATELYCASYDDEARVIYEEVLSNDVLFETIHNFNGTILFEGYGDNYIKNYVLNEAKKFYENPTSFSGGLEGLGRAGRASSNVAAAARAAARARRAAAADARTGEFAGVAAAKAREAIAQKDALLAKTAIRRSRDNAAVKAAVSRGAEAKANSMEKLLDPTPAKKSVGGLWDTIKSFGAGLVNKLKGIASAGIAWLQPLLRNGLSFIATNPIAKVALPALAIAGGVGASIALINKLRKKAGEKKISKEEEKEIKAIAGKNKEKLKSARKKLKKAA
jgi:hypothetical protein